MNKFLLFSYKKTYCFTAEDTECPIHENEMEEEPEEEDVTSFKFPSTSWRDDRPVRVEPNIPPGGGMGPALPQTTKRNDQDADCKNCW